MQLNIQSVHFDADKKLLGFINEKVGKLNHFYGDIIGTDVTLRIDKSKTSDNKVAEIRIKIPGNDLFAKRQCKTFEEATDTAVNALKQQIKKHKERVRSM